MNKKIDKEELYKILLNSPVDKYPLLNEIYAIRDKPLETKDYTIAVNGFISVDSLLNNYNLINEKQQLISWLEDKIKNITNYAISFGLTIDKDISHEIDIKKQIFQEVLDYVKGDKE